LIVDIEEAIRRRFGCGARDRFIDRAHDHCTTRFSAVAPLSSWRRRSTSASHARCNGFVDGHSPSSIRSAGVRYPGSASADSHHASASRQRCWSSVGSRGIFTIRIARLGSFCDGSRVPGLVGPGNVSRLACRYRPGGV
jgi:hypothetical protein